VKYYGSRVQGGNEFSATGKETLVCLPIMSMRIGRNALNSKLK
jgi:hypothetical protein